MLRSRFRIYKVDVGLLAIREHISIHENRNLMSTVCTGLAHISGNDGLEYRHSNCLLNGIGPVTLTL
jgi:hypothetical protein